jgi:hypothetical protein
MNAVELYVKAWNTIDVSDRYNLLKQCFADDASYIDDHIKERIYNLDAMQNMIAGFRSVLDHELKIEGLIKFHHDVFQFNWLLENSQGILSKGNFTGSLNEAGKINMIIGFLK